MSWESNDNGERFVDFCSINHLVICGTIFQHKPCHKVSWISSSGRTSNQIDHFAISRRFRGCVMNERNKREADIGHSLHHFLMVATQSVNLSSFDFSTIQHWMAVKGIFRSAEYDTVGRPPRGRRKCPKSPGCSLKSGTKSSV